MIYLYSTDGNGADAIIDVLGHKELVRFPVVRYMDFDKHVTSIVSQVTPKDIVIVDTIDMLAATWRGDHNLGTDPTETMWGKKERFFKEKPGYGLYTGPEGMIIRQLKNLSRGGEGAKIITTVHEAVRIDETTVPPTKKRSPDLNPALLGSLMGSSSHVFRMARINEPIFNDQNEEVVSAGSRILQLRVTVEYTAKAQYEEKLPKALTNPTLPRLWKLLGFVPTWLTVYGPPGVGKSTFVTSSLREKV